MLSLGEWGPPSSQKAIFPDGGGVWAHDRLVGLQLSQGYVSLEKGGLRCWGFGQPEYTAKAETNLPNLRTSDLRRKSWSPPGTTSQVRHGFLIHLTILTILCYRNDIRRVNF